MITLDYQSAQDLPAVEKLLDQAFGADRYMKASYRLRAGVEAKPELSFTAKMDGVLYGTLRFWQAQLFDQASGTVRPILFLGPIAISRDKQGLGIGAKLLSHGLRRAKAMKIGPVFLVGSCVYYQRYGFSDLGGRSITLPDGQDGDRLLVLGCPDLHDLPQAGLLLPDNGLSESAYTAA